MNYKSFVNVFSKTKKTSFAFSDEVPTAAFDMKNDSFIINPTFYKDLSDKMNKYAYTPSEYPFYYLLGHELGHQWWTHFDPDRYPEPKRFFQFVQNVVEDTYIEFAWQMYTRQRQLQQMNQAMRFGRRAMCGPEYCQMLEEQELTLEVRLQMLIAYAYNPDYEWSVEFLPQHLLTFFDNTTIIIDDELRFEQEIEFAKALMNHFQDEAQNMQQPEQAGDSDQQADGESDSQQSVAKQLDKIIQNMPEQFQPQTFEEMKRNDEGGTIISAKELEEINSNGLNIYMNSSPRVASDNYMTLFNNFNAVFNKYKFRTFNSMSYNERKGELDLHNIPFSNVRLDIFKKQNKPKREFDLEFALLFDYSGSMDHLKHIVSDIGAALSVACIKNHIPITALAFSDENYLLFDKKNRNKEQVKNLFFNAAQDVDGGTDFLYSIKYVTNTLNRSLKKDKVIILITDGETYHEKEIAEYVKKSNHYILPIGIDIQGSSQQFDRIFSDNDRIYITTKEVKHKLPDIIISKVYKKFMKGSDQQ